MLAHATNEIGQRVALRLDLFVGERKRVGAGTAPGTPSFRYAL